MSSHTLLTSSSELLDGVYSVDVHGSPSKLVILSAKNNELLAHYFKSSINELANSPCKKITSNVYSESSKRSTLNKEQCSNLLK